MRGTAIIIGLTLILSGGAAWSDAFNGSADYEVDSLGYYYAITGGLFPTGPTPNGSSASGGTFRYVTDCPEDPWPIDVWHKDGWFEENAGLAVTLMNGGSIIYDNNGIETGTYGDYYNATAQGLDSADTPGLYRGWCMSNNYDFIYSGYFYLEEETTIDTMIGYFDPTSGFNPNSQYIQYNMNIWSNVDGDLLPVNTGGFNGDVFTSDTTAGTFSWGDTGVDRVFGADYGSVTDDIYSLTYTLDVPITLEAGIYWFSHDAEIVSTPEPASLTALLLMGLGGITAHRFRRKK